MASPVREGVRGCKAPAYEELSALAGVRFHMLETACQK